MSSNPIPAPLEYNPLSEPHRGDATELAPVIGCFWHLWSQGPVVPHAFVQAILHTGRRRGDAEAITSTVADRLGNRPRARSSRI